jgi:hypothetical protein
MSFRLLIFSPRVVCPVFRDLSNIDLLYSNLHFSLREGLGGVGRARAQ